MTLPDQASPRKPPNKIWLYGPFIVLLLAAIGWGACWSWAAGEGERRIETQVGQLRARGWNIAWTDLSVSGWPFRFSVKLTDLRVIDPSGRGVETARLNAVAYAYAPRRWVAASPGPVTLHRGKGASVVMIGRRIRLGLEGLGDAHASATFEGAGLNLLPPAGQPAFPLSGAERILLSFRQGPDDQGAVLFSGKGLTTQGGGLFARLSTASKADLDLEMLLTRRAALTRSDNWLGALAAWRTAGGQLNVRKARLAVGELAISSSGGPLGIDQDSRVQGALSLDLSEAGGWAAVAQALGAYSLSFADGQARAGPAYLGPAPRLY